VAAAQAGFIDGPRVLANMALDSWVPHRFAALSERLTTSNGIVLMGGAALAALLYTHGDVRLIVVLYSINVFVTFSLSMAGMAGALWRQRGGRNPWLGQFALFACGLAVCAMILVLMVVQKFTEGAWVTLLITGGVVGVCFFIRRHYRTVNAKLAALFTEIEPLTHAAHKPMGEVDPAQPTAAVLVGGYTGLGIYTARAVLRAFPGYFRNMVFLSVGVLDSGV
jgi:hypothetical protein